MAKRCEKASNRVSSLLELHLLIYLREKSLVCIKTNSDNALDKQFSLQEQIERFTELINELRDCEQDCVAKIREHFAELTRDSANFFPNRDSSPETSIDSLSESDTDEKQPKPNQSVPTSLTSLLLPAISCREQIQAIEASYKELFYAITEQINSLTEREENANLISTQLENIHDRAMSLIQTITDLNQPKFPVLNLPEHVIVPENSIIPPVPTNEVSPPNEPVPKVILPHTQMIKPWN